MIQRVERRVGSASKTRRYDLPLHQDEGTGFLIVLVALMAFLSTIVLSFSFSLTQIMDSWSEGLENKMTIEIPAKADGALRSDAEIKALQQAVLDKLASVDTIDTLEPLEDQTLKNLVQSWLGQSSFFDELPMPALISVQLKSSSPAIISALDEVVKGIDPQAHIDTHESWLSDLFRLTGSMQVALLVVVIVIGMTTIAAIAGAMKAQVEIHRDDVELLHLMGAHDRYIVRQFIRHAGLLSLNGSLSGVGGALVILGIIHLVFKEQHYSFMPDIAFGAAELTMLGMIPVAIGVISALSARFTVLQVLSKMP